MKGLLYVIIKKPDRRIIQPNLPTLPIIDVRDLVYEDLPIAKCRYGHQRPDGTEVSYGASGRLSPVYRLEATVIAIGRLEV